MIPKALITAIAFCFSNLIFAQPGNKTINKPQPDSFAINAKLIIKESKNGFVDHRYNELEGEASISYSTTLPNLGFEKKFVQTGSVAPYKQTSLLTLPYFIATSSFPDVSAANQFYYHIKRKLVNAMRPFGQDSSAKAGFSRYSSIIINKPVKDSFVTIELFIFPDAKSNLVGLRIFHSKASLQKGNMKSPPVAANKNHYNMLIPLLEVLMEHSPDNFIRIRETLLQNEKWKPTYSSKVTFRDFRFPKIEYVTQNLWNQYTTNFFIKDEEAAKLRFQELALEIEKNKSSIPSMRFEERSSPTEKWWYIEHGKKDIEGKGYKNSLRLSLTKFEYGEGYYITFEFRKSVG